MAKLTSRRSGRGASKKAASETRGGYGSRVSFDNSDRKFNRDRIHFRSRFFLQRQGTLPRPSRGGARVTNDSGVVRLARA
jgi:hypothetical protein